MRLTKKSEKFINAYEWNAELPTKTFIQLSMNKLGQLEDMMEKYNFETVEDLDNFIQSCINRIKYENKKEKYL